MIMSGTHLQGLYTYQASGRNACILFSYFPLYCFVVGSLCSRGEGGIIALVKLINGPNQSKLCRACSTCPKKGLLTDRAWSSRHPLWTSCVRASLVR